MNSYTILKTTHVNDLILVADETNLIGIYFSGKDHVPADLKKWKLDPSHPVLKQAVQELKEYLAGRRTEFTLPLHANGSDFQRAVWREIARIPFGSTITYSELASRAGNARAAGTATGSNPLAIVVPCHRVMGKDGALRGFAGGLDNKRALLKVESKPGLLKN